MERVKGIEPSSQAWEAHILPLNHTRFRIEWYLTKTGTLFNGHFTGTAASLLNRQFLFSSRRALPRSCLVPGRCRLPARAGAALHQCAVCPSTVLSGAL